MDRIGVAIGPIICLCRLCGLLNAKINEVWKSAAWTCYSIYLNVMMSNPSKIISIYVLHLHHQVHRQQQQAYWYLLLDLYFIITSYAVYKITKFKIWLQSRWRRITSQCIPQAYFILSLSVHEEINHNL